MVQKTISKIRRRLRYQPLKWTLRKQQEQRSFTKAIFLSHRVQKPSAAEPNPGNTAQPSRLQKHANQSLPRKEPPYKGQTRAQRLKGSTARSRARGPGVRAASAGISRRADFRRGVYALPLSLWRRCTAGAAHTYTYTACRPSIDRALHSAARLSSSPRGSRPPALFSLSLSLSLPLVSFFVRAHYRPNYRRREIDVDRLQEALGDGDEEEGGSWMLNLRWVALSGVHVYEAAAADRKWRGM